MGVRTDSPSREVVGLASKLASESGAVVPQNLCLCAYRRLAFSMDSIRSQIRGICLELPGTSGSVITRLKRQNPGKDALVIDALREGLARYAGPWGKAGEGPASS